MKFPKQVKRYCRYCRRHTVHRIVQAKVKERGALKKGSISRAKKRGRGQGYGNKGRWGSKPSKPKRTGAKSSKKTNLKFICKECKKTTLQGKSFRAKKVLFE